nr:topless-related protein 4 isoform X1 [Ipomoea batatas]
MERDDLLHMVLQFLEKQNYKETLHSLERESRVFFNLRYFEEKVIQGEWDELEKYMSGFVNLDNNVPSLKLFFEIRLQKYLEALDSGDKMNALKILRDDLNVFAVFDTLYFKKTAGLMGLDNIREAPHLSNYVDAQTARASFLNKLRTLIMENPLLRDKLQLPTLPEGSLHTMINQSLNWQHLHCENSVEVPIIRTLFVDHACEQLNDDQPLSPEVNNVNSSDNIPNTVVANLSQGSSV